MLQQKLDTDTNMEVTLTSTAQTLAELLSGETIPSNTDSIIIQPQTGSMRWYPANNDPTTSRGFITTQNNFLDKSGAEVQKWKFARDGGTDVTAVVSFGISTNARS